LSFDPGAGGIAFVTWSPDGRIGASAHFDGSVRLWNPADGAELRRLVGHTAIVNGICFNPDGTRLASASNDTTVRLWDPETGEPLTTLRSHEHWVSTVAFSPDCLRIASGGGSYDGSDCALRIWEAHPAKHWEKP
jgi:WD40 repeat protein